jgi:diadenylate cyclase
MAVIGVVVYMVVRFIQGTRAAGALKGLIVLIVVGTLTVRVLGQREEFQRLQFLYDNFLTIAAVGLVVIFQPELRRGLTRLGETPLFRRTPKGLAVTVEEIAEAAAFLSRARFGAIIVIEREAQLKSFTEGGTVLNAAVSARLLQTIFFPGTALHDLAVVIRGSQILAAGVQLPLAEPAQMPDPTLGSRHRAAVGITSECDALALVVSEETGTISLAEHGRLTRNLSRAELEDLLLSNLRAAARKQAAAAPEPEIIEPAADALEPAGPSHDPGSADEHAGQRA